MSKVVRSACQACKMCMHNAHTCRVPSQFFLLQPYLYVEIDYLLTCIHSNIVQQALVLASTKYILQIRQVTINNH